MTKQVNPEVAYKKGLYYLKGEGEGKSLEKARECFEEAASQGSEQALFELGEMYWWGKPGKDVKKAIHYYELAADKGDEDAQHALGFAYQYGHGVEVDLEKAIDLLMKAAMQGQSEAQNRIGNAYRSGEGVRQNHTAAYNWYRQSSVFNSHGMCNLVYTQMDTASARKR